MEAMYLSPMNSSSGGKNNASSPELLLDANQAPVLRLIYPYFSNDDDKCYTIMRDANLSLIIPCVTLR